MQPRNTIGIETHWGFRTFELYEGDLTSPEFAADLLVVSAFLGNYAPTTRTLIGALLKNSKLDSTDLPPVPRKCSAARGMNPMGHFAACAAWSPTCCTSILTRRRSWRSPWASGPTTS